MSLLTAASVPSNRTRAAPVRPVTHMVSTARNATPAVTVIGSPAELTIWVTGRTGAARVRFDGTEAAVGRLTGTNWR